MDASNKIDDTIPDVDIKDVVIDLNLYGLVSIKKACYKFTSECSVQIHNVMQDKVKVRFSFPHNVDIHVKEKLLNDFHNELLDQDLREIIFKETEPVRNLILAQAFSKTSLLESE